MKKEIMYSVIGFILGSAGTTLGLLGLRELKEAKRNKSSYKNSEELDKLEEKLKLDLQNLVIEKQLKKGSVEYIKEALKLHENFVKAAEPLVNSIDNKVLYSVHSRDLMDSKVKIDSLRNDLNILLSNPEIEKV